MKKILLDTNAYTSLLYTPIPINDVWIASHGLESGATVITYDGHFKHVSGLRIWGP